MHNVNNCISPKQVITIFNILRDIGINTTHRGSKYLNKAIQLLLTENNDIIVIENVYIAIAKYYGTISAKQVKNSITYALNSRIEEKSIRNFEKVFNFEYDSYYFTNKILIEEIYRILKNYNF